MIKISSITKTLELTKGISSTILNDFSFDVINEKIYSIVGPAGAGKTLLLQIISGLKQADSGSIEKDEYKKIIYIPSEPSSFPWLNVEENIFFGLGKNSSTNVADSLKLVELDGYEKHYPVNSSIGFRFRISLARAFANNPSLICIDDSFTGLDELTKVELFVLIRRLNKLKKIPFLFATSSISDSLIISDYVLLLRKNPGEIIKTYHLDLPDERNYEIITDNRFLELKGLIEKDFNTIVFLRK
jgi:NitT/TauT family transport system ATP-binding protein